MHVPARPMLILLALLALGAAPATRPTTAPIVAGPKPPTTRTSALASTPKTIDDLRAIQQRVEAVVASALPATVGVLNGASQGSGVIISRDGYVLTAGHVAAEPNRDVTLILSDGRRVKGRTLGINRGIDSGLIKITQQGAYPFVPIAKSADVRVGQWCVALGHPGGYRRDRPPVLRLGRVLFSSDRVIGTDCTLVGGDSGGPLFDLDGNVIGIHSRIGASAQANMHVPTDTFVETWERLASAEAWGTMLGLTGRGAVLGINGGDDPKGCKVNSVADNSAAAKAGLTEGDIITKFDGQLVTGLTRLGELIARKRPGDSVKLEVLRDGKKVDVLAQLGGRG